jgi:hypothetical protein
MVPSPTEPIEFSPQQYAVPVAVVPQVPQPPAEIDVHCWSPTTRVGAELRVVVCDAHGRMLSIVTGRATVSAPSRGARIAELREQALAEAVGAMSRSLQSQLARASS